MKPTIISIAVAKGGSAKTTTAHAVGSIFERDHSILWFDVDPQKSLSMAVADLSGTTVTGYDVLVNKLKSMEVAYAADPQKALAAIQSGKTSSSKEVRKPSGAIAGGRFVAGAVQFRENSTNGSFSLRINFDPSRTPADTKQEIVRRLETLLSRLKS